MKLICFHAAIGELFGCGTRSQATELVRLDNSVGRVLAIDIRATTDSPTFTNSAVDGYAVFHEDDLRKNASFVVKTESAAGGAPTTTRFSKGVAMRVFTGAPLPKTCVGVHMQEDIAADSQPNSFRVTAKAKAGQHIRIRATEFAKGTQLVRAGTVINPGLIALLASQGLSNLQCRKKPSVIILSTGDELVPVNKKPGPGQIRNSNAPMLGAIVEQLGGKVTKTLHVRDNLSRITAALRQAAENAQLVLISGGASVGDHDHAVAALKSLGKLCFHGVSMKPGKPVAAGKIGKCCVICLPGNPASAFVCAHLFVDAALISILNHRANSPGWTPVTMRSKYKTGAREEFVRCNLTLGEATIVGEQASFGTVSLAEANCIVAIPPNTTVKPGDKLRAWLTQ